MQLKLLILALTLTSTALASDIEFKAPQSFPEGLTYNPQRKEFYVTSLRQGVVGRVTQNGKYSVLNSKMKKDLDLVSLIGANYDAPRNRLLVCVSDPGVGAKTNPSTQKKLARLLVLNPVNGSILKKIELHSLYAGDHFCNDMAVDHTGNIFVTDSFSPVIYKIDNQYQASVFATDDRFKGEGFNLNGIVVHPDGYLIVSKYNDGTLFKVNLKNPKEVHSIMLEKNLPGADGLILTPAQELIVIQNTDQNKVRNLKSEDSFLSAKVTATFDPGTDFPTTGTFMDGKYYVLMSHIAKLFAGDPSAAKQATFKIKEIKF